jgi:hypothetical protein
MSKDKNITVNGTPLAEYISQETGKEAQQVRAADLRTPKIRKAIVSKSNGNHSHARSGPVQVVYDPNQKAQKVIMRGTVYPWAEKGVFGFVSSGESISGGIECTEDMTEIKCHECVDWFTSLAHHIVVHKISSRDYKIKHGLAQKTSLLSPQFAQLKRTTALNYSRQHALKFRQSSAPRLGSEANRAAIREGRLKLKKDGYELKETYNMRMACMIQLTCRLTNMAAKMGRCPTQIEMRDGDEFGPIDHHAIKSAFHMTVVEALRSIGLNPHTKNSQIADTIRLKILKLRSRGQSYSEIAHLLNVHDTTARKYAAVTHVD